ncbi:MAG: PhnD/SsuA/transferrin family substrate-binding protein [Gammaproteobacteria bacterium]|nr:PhnD/SsuA/transferrin family substrate-binding protein [Gammaproteobacteria bacterium]
MLRRAILVSSISFVLSLVAAAAHADRAPVGPMLQASAAKSDALNTPAVTPDVLVFTAPPRETPEMGREIYQPIAEYLSRATGKNIVYRHQGTWGVYRTEMLKGGYDLVFDGPHFNSYRTQKLSHNILVKLPERHEFAVIVKKDQPFTAPTQMFGRTFCTHAPPQLGTLVLLSQFDNPSRQPVILSTDGWDKIYQGVMSGKCTGGVLPMANLRKFDKDGQAKIIFKTAAMPNQALSAGPRVTAEDQAKIVGALLSPEGSVPTAKLRAAYKGGNSFAPATNSEYVGLAEYLRSEWGYY